MITSRCGIFKKCYLYRSRKHRAGTPGIHPKYLIEVPWNAEDQTDRVLVDGYRNHFTPDRYRIDHSSRLI